MKRFTVLIFGILLALGLVGYARANPAEGTWFDLNKPTAAKFRTAIDNILAVAQTFESNALKLTTTSTGWEIVDKRGEHPMLWTYTKATNQLSGPFAHEDEQSAQQQLHGLLELLRQAGGSSSFEPFTAEETKILTKLCEKILSGPRGLVRVVMQADAYRIAFNQASAIYIFSPTRRAALRMESAYPHGFIPTRDYGHRDFKNLVGEIASEANEVLPSPSR